MKAKARSYARETCSHLTTGTRKKGPYRMQWKFCCKNIVCTMNSISNSPDNCNTTLESTELPPPPASLDWKIYNDWVRSGDTFKKHYITQRSLICQWYTCTVDISCTSTNDLPCNCHVCWVILFITCHYYTLQPRIKWIALCCYIMTALMFNVCKYY